jgi:hypothetical protein
MDRPQKAWLRGRPSISRIVPLSSVREQLSKPSSFDLMRYRFDVPLDCSVELTPLGYQFFTDIFEVFDKVFFLLRLVTPRGIDSLLPGQGRCSEQR